MTYGERRKRADVQLILKDMEELESVFLSKTQKLNNKRHSLLLKKMEKLVPELETAYDKGDEEEVEGILKSITLPSSKEWGKNIHSLVNSSAKNGVLRAHLELLRLRELYEFDANDWDINVIVGGSDWEVVFPPEAEAWIKKYAYEIGVITEDTVIEKIREELLDTLKNGTRGRDTIANIEGISSTWIKGTHHAKTIARTETAKMYNAGRLAKWLDPSQNGFVEALQYDAITDTRTTDLCKGLDGKIIAISNAKMVAELTPPNHFMCRASWIPVTKYEEWEDDFPKDAEPEKGFQFEVKLAGIIAKPKPPKGGGKKKPKPLVVPKKKIDPNTETNPDVIRSLNDDDFRTAIGNIKDYALKLSMVKERAEKMVIEKGVLKEVDQWGRFQSFGFVDSVGSFEWFGQTFEFHLSTKKGQQDFMKWYLKVMQVGKDNDKTRELMQEFIDEHGGKVNYMGVCARLKEALKASSTGKDLEWTGLKERTDTTAESKKLFTIKEPPKTPNYKAARTLHKALEDGQKWLLKFMHPRTAPQTGVKLRFKNDLQRAYAQGGTGEIFFGRSRGEASVIVHETGHVVHWQNKDIADLVHEFFMNRTKNKSIAKKEWNWGSGKEWAFPDDFIEYYTGREYGWEMGQRARYNHGFMGQEVLSMGLQHMYANAEGFYKSDKDHFLFTYAIMEGLF